MWMEKDGIWTPKREFKEGAGFSDIRVAAWIRHPAYC